jgi:hypothetical protein
LWSIWSRSSGIEFVVQSIVSILLYLLSKLRMTMKAIDIDTTLIDGYLRLLDNLSPSNKLDLISKLTLSVKTDISDRKNSFYEAFGAWQSNQSDEQIVNDIRRSRVFNRQIEQF